MIRTRFFSTSFAAIALAAAFSVGSACRHAVDLARGFVTYASKRAMEFLRGVAAVFEAPSLKHPEPAKRLVQACAYALGLAKRERPVTFGTWRMCPSA